MINGLSLSKSSVIQLSTKNLADWCHYICYSSIATFPFLFIPIITPILCNSLYLVSIV